MAYVMSRRRGALMAQAMEQKDDDDSQRDARKHGQLPAAQRADELDEG